MIKIVITTYAVFLVIVSIAVLRAVWTSQGGGGWGKLLFPNSEFVLILGGVTTVFISSLFYLIPAFYKKQAHGKSIFSEVFDQGSIYFFGTFILSFILAFGLAFLAYIFVDSKT